MIVAGRSLRSRFQKFDRRKNERIASCKKRRRQPNRRLFFLIALKKIQKDSSRSATREQSNFAIFAQNFEKMAQKEVSILSNAAQKWPSPWLWAALTTVLATLVLPKNASFLLDFEAGKTWRHETLAAPFDFDVLKSESEAAPQLRALDSLAAPYFLMNNEVARAQKKAFEKAFADRLATSRHDLQYSDIVSNPSAYLNFSTALLDGIFARGIVQNDSFLNQKGSKRAIFLIKSPTSETRTTLGELFTMASATDFLTDTLPYSSLSNPEFLLPILEKSLAPNVFRSDSLGLILSQKKRDAILKTGVSVQKGETLARKGEIVGALEAQKIHSLAQKMGAEDPLRSLAGRLILFGLASAALALLALTRFPELWDDRRNGAMIFGAVAANLLIFSALARLGLGVPLLAPMLFMPFFLHSFYPKELVWPAFLLSVLMTGLALEWSFGWAVVQFAGGFALLLFPRRVLSWRGRAVVAATAAGAMTLALAGCVFAGKIPPSVAAWDLILFVWTAAFLSLLAFPAADFFRRLA